MSAKSGLPEYFGDGESVWAAKITSVEPFNRGDLIGCARLGFAEEDRHANIIPRWVQQFNPQVGGYFVCFAEREPIFLLEDAFKQRYTLVAKD